MLQILVNNSEYLLSLLAGLSVITFFVSIFCIPLIIARLPRDYFKNPQDVVAKQYTPASIAKVIFFFLRNIIGFLLLTAGIAMLFLPGQGIITMIVGIGVMSFPYKQYLLYRITRPASIQTTMNWIRKKTGKTSFIW